MTSTQRATRRRTAGAAGPALRLVPVARHGRTGLLRTTALQAVALFGLAAGAAAPHAVAQPAPNARPQGGAVVGGSATIAQSPTKTSVTQSSQRAAVDWTSFDVGSKQTVTFTAPSPSDVTLSQVTGPDPSQIAGHIVANDQLVLVNRSGVVFSKGAEVDTAGLVVSASGIAAGAFMQGSTTFDIAPNPGAKIENRGKISVKDRGLAALVAPQVANDGTITARMGRVTLAGAEAHTVDLYGDGMLSINVTKQVTKASLGGQQVDALVTNSGLVRADGGTVTLTAQAVDGLVTTLVSAGGKVAADTAGGRAGTVLIDGVGGSVRVTGEVSAQGVAAGAQGGQIEVNATQVASVAAGARLNASGSGGGGTIAVGTTLARAQGGPSVKPATTARGTLVEKGATLSADAAGSGRGGRVTVLSTQATVFEGAITARGGAQAGDGGQAEVSGAAGFVLTGSVDLSAAHGAKGSLLLDPTNLEIVPSGGNIDTEIGASGSVQLLAVTKMDSATPPSTVDTVYLTKIGNLADIQLQASQMLTVMAPITVANALTLQAGDTLTVNAGAPISAKSVTLSAATAGFGGTTTGALTLNAAVTATGGGVILMAGTNGVTLNSAISAAGVAVTTTGKLTLAAGSTVDVAAGTVDLSAVGVAQDPTSKITAGLLQSTSGITGAASFAGTANAIAALGNVAFSNGAFALRDATALTVQGAVFPGGVENGAAGGDLRLTVGTGAGQALTIGSATHAGTLEVGAAFTLSLSADAIAVGKAGASVVAGAGGTIEIAPLTSQTNVSVNGTTAGALDVPLASLGLVDGGLLRIGAVNTVTTAKNISFDAATDVSALGSLDLEASGAVTEAAGASLTAATVSGNVGSLSLPNGANSIQTLTAFAASGDIALTQAAPLSIFGKISGADIDLTVTQAGGSITLGGGQAEVAHLVAATGGTITLTADNLFSAFNATASAPGGLVRIAPYNNEDVVVGSGSGATIELPAISAATVAIGTGGMVMKASSIVFEGPADIGGATLDLETSGSATQLEGGGVTAGGLTGTATSLDFAVAGATNHIGQIGSFKATTGSITLTTLGDIAATGTVQAATGVTLTASGGTITQSSGTISATSGTLTLTADSGISFAGTLSAPTVTLASSGGAVAESPSVTPTGVVDAATLTFSAGGAGTFATASGTGFGNQVGKLGASSATGDIVFFDGQSLTLAGATKAANISVAVQVKAGAIATAAPASLTVDDAGTLTLAADALTLSSSLSLNAPDGVIEVAPHTKGVGVTVGASVPGDLSFQTVGGDALNLDLGDSGTLRLGAAAGATSAGTIQVAAALNLAGETLDLEATGAVTQTSGGAVKAAVLTGNALSVDLTTSPANAIGTLQSFTAAGAPAIPISGSFKLKDSAPLDVIGTVTAGAEPTDVIALTVTQAGGAITLGAGGESPSGELVATHGASVTLQSDVLALGDSGGSISAPGATVSIAPFSTTAMVVGGPGATVELPTLTAATLTLGKVGTTTATDITLAGVLAIPTTTLDLEASGAATQSAAVTAAGLTATVGSLNLGLSTNMIGPVGPLTATTGGISLTDMSAITLVGDVKALSASPGADILLTTTGGSITQNSGLVEGATGNQVTLTASGSILFGGTVSGGTVMLKALGGMVSENPTGLSDTGVVQATELEALAGEGAIDLATRSPFGGGNQVATLGDSSATGGTFSLADGRALTVLGAVSGTDASVSVARGVPATTVTTVTFGTSKAAGSLTSGSGGVVSVTADGILESGLGGSLSAPNGGTVEITPATVGAEIAVGGMISSPGTLGISLAALNFTTGAAGTLRLGSANDVQTAGAITFVAPANLTKSGTLVGTLDLEATGAVTQTAASPLTVPGLTGTAASVDLSTATANMIGAVNGFKATGGGFKLTDASSLVVSGTLTAGAAASDQIALTVTKAGGAITLGSVPARAAPTPGLLTATGGASVALQADQLLLATSNDAISAPGATVAIAPYDAVAMIVGGDAATVQLVVPTAATLILGKVGAATTATDISLAALPALGATTLDLEASGTVSQVASVSTAALTGTVGALTLGSTGNAIGSIGKLTATGDAPTGLAGTLTFTDGQSLVLGGPLAAEASLTLTAKAGGGTAGDIAVTQPLTAGAAITLTADGQITLSQPLAAGTAIALTAGGQITQTGGALTAGSLSASAAGGQVLLNGTTNAVGVLQASSATGGFTFQDDAALVVNAAVSGASVTLIVNAAGQALTLGDNLGHAAALTATAATQPTVTLQADVVNLGSAGGSVTAKDAAGDGLVQIAPLTPNTAFGTAAVPLQLPTFTTDTLRVGEIGTVTTAASILFGSPVVVPGGTLDVEAPGLVSQTAAAGVTAALLVGNVGTLDFPSAQNMIGALGSITATSGEIAVDDALDITISQSISAASIQLTTGGTITQTGGTVTATAALGSVGLTAGEAITQIAGTITATGAAGSVDLSAGGALSIGGLVAAPNVALTSVLDAVTETLPAQMTATGVIRATLLTGSSGGATLLDTTSTPVVGNQVAQLGSFAASGGLFFKDGEALMIAGDVSGAAVTLTVAGAITETTGALDVGLLAGLASGAVSLGGAGNLVAQLGGFSAQGAFTLVDGQALAIIGNVAGADVNITTTAGGITQALATTITATGSVSLTSALGIAFGGTIDPASVHLVALDGDITETLPGPPAPAAATGVIVASLLTGSAVGGSALLDTPSPAGTGNQVAQLGTFATRGDLILVDGEALTVAGNLSSAVGSVLLTANGGTLSQGAGLTISAPAGTIDLTASSDVAFAGTLTAPAVGLVSTKGSLFEALGTLAPTGVIQTALLTGSAVDGSALLTTTPPAAAGNQVAQLGAFATGGALTLVDQESLTVVGLASSSAGDVTLTASGAAADIMVSSTVQSLAGAATLTAGRDIVVTGSVQAGTVATLAATTGDVTQSGLVTAPSLSETAGGSINDSGLSIATAGPATLTASGTIAQSAGTIMATGGGVTLAAGGGAITQGAGALIADPTAGQTVALTAASGIAFGGTISAAGTASLVAKGGDISETGGVVLAGLLTGSASGQVSFGPGPSSGSGNLVAQLGAFSAGGDLTLVDGEALTVVANLASAAGAVTLTVNGGALSQGEGLTILAPRGAIDLMASSDVAFAGTLAAPAVSLVSSLGNVFEAIGTAASTGVIQTGLLTGSASGAALLATQSPGGAGNQVGKLGPFATGGALTLVDGEALTVVGDVSSSKADVALTANGATADITVSSAVSALGSATLTAGRSIDVGGMVQAGADATLAAMTGDIADSGLVVAGHAATLTAAGSIDATGTVQAGTVATLAATTGDVTQSGLVTAPSLSETAGGSINDSGLSIATAGPATLTASGTIAQSAGTIMATGGGVTLAAGGGAITQGAGALIADPTAGQTVALTAASGIAFGGTISAAGTADLVAQGGDVAETGGVLLATLLTGSATGQALFGTLSPAGSGNLVAQLGNFTTGGSFTLADGEALKLVGILDTPGGFKLTTGVGDFTQAPGSTITAPGAGAVIAIDSAGGIAFGGTLNAINGTVSLIARNGDVTETAPDGTGPTGVVIAQSLTGSASGMAAFDTQPPAGGGNLVTNLGPFATGGALTLVDGEALTVVSTVTSSAGDVTLKTIGLTSDLTVTGTVSAFGSALLTAGRTIDSAGTVMAGAAADLTAGGAITQPSGLIAGGAGGATLTASGGSISQAPGASISDPDAAAISLSASAQIAFGGTISTVGGAVSLIAAGGDVTEVAVTATSPSGVLLASSLTGSASGQALLSTQAPAGSNLVGTLSAFKTGGDFTLVDGEALVVSGPLTAVSGATPGAVRITLNGPASDLALQGGVTAAGSVMLTAGGAISQTSGTLLATDGSVTLAALGGSISQSAGAVVSDPAAGAAVSLTASGGIAFGGTITTPGTVSLVAQGGDVTEIGPQPLASLNQDDVSETPPTQPAATGVVIAGLLTGSASGQGLFTTPSPAGGGNEVAAIGPFTTGGPLSLLDGRSLTVSGAVASTGGDVALTVNGAASDLTVASSVTAAGAATLDAERGVIVTGSVRAGGTADLTASGDVDQAGLVTALVVNETAGGAILSSGSSLATGGAATLLAGSGISQPSGTIMAAGGVSLTAMGGSVTQGAGAVVSGAPVGVVASGEIAFGGLITTAGAATLTAQGGDVTETFGGSGPTGILVASSLSGSASGQALFDRASPGGGGNQVGSLGSFATGGDFVLFDGAALAVAGPATASAGATPGDVTITVGGAANGLTLAGDVTAAGAGALSAGAGITQSSGVVQASGATLTLSALGGSITQASGAELSAPSAGAAIGLSASDAIMFGGVVAAPGSVSLVAMGGDASESGGVVQTALLTGTVHGQARLDTTSPAGSGNLIGQIGAFSAGGDLVLVDGETLTASGSQSAADIALTVAGSFAQSPGGTLAAAGTLSATAAGGISFAGALSAATASLVAESGSIVEAVESSAQAGGVAQFGTLSGSATGDVSLNNEPIPGPGNQIGQIDGLTAGGSVALQDYADLTVAGAVAARSGTATIMAHGAALTVTGSVSASGATTLFSDGTLTQAGSVTGASVSEATSGALEQSGATTATSGDVVLAPAGAFEQTGGSVSATLGNLTVNAGGTGIAFGGTLSAAQTVTLNAGSGGISETAPGAASPTGQVVAAVLTGSAAGPIVLNGPNNRIGQVSALLANGSLTLTDAAALTVSGSLSVPGGALSLTSGGDLTLAAPVTASSAELTATAGDVTESGSGVLTLGSLSGSAAGSAAFGSANQVGSLGPFATGSGFSLTDAGALSVTASVSAARGPVAITAGGGLTQTAGTISAGGGGSAATLTSAGGFTQMAGAAIRDQDAAGGVAVTAQSLTLGGAISAAGAPVTLTARSGPIAQVGGGYIQAGSLAGSAAGPATFGDEAANQVARLGGFTSGGAFQLLDGTALTVSGPLAGQTVDLETPGAVTLAGGRISAAFVAGGSQYAALLGASAAPPGPADGIYIKAAGVTQTGVTAIDPNAPVQTNPAAQANPTTPGPVLSIVLAGGRGAVQFADLDAPAVQLFTSLGDGTLSGLIDTAGLHVDTSAAAGGGATLTGVVAGQLGTSAAGVADIAPLRNSRYQINSCPLGSVNCILLSPILVPVSNPVQDVEVSGVGSRQDDPDLILPNVGEQDF